MNYKYTAIIIEPRKHKALEFVLNNVCDCLSNEWKIVLFHGINNADYSNNIINKLNLLYDNRINTVDLVVENLNLIEYSKLLTTKSIIYDHIDTDVFLVFQTDSMIFKKNAYLLDTFLEYDYVGSPWLVTNYLPTSNCDFIGNGGFSLRNKNKMLEIIKKRDWNSIEENDNRYEDLFFSTKYSDVSVRKPEYKKACSFSVDEVFSEICFACHKPWVHNHYNLFKTNYPEVELLFNLQEVELN
uniref:DUF5672 domain-containing protein n=1 Tax=viral metagenome TaxID=1070528 RepID=A0A6C0JG80_9ZZZZ